MELRRWSVSELVKYIRGVFETDFRLQELELEGEVINLRIPASGHLYFNLRDANSQIACVMWSSERGLLAVPPTEGARIIATGLISIYEKTGQLQFYCRRIRLLGDGDLLYEYEKLKQQLFDEGVFDVERKLPIPEEARKVAIITSETGAALQDALNVFERRMPLAEIFLYPVLVQGEPAAEQIMRALAVVNQRTDIDLCLIVRGGGASEDLWAFNNPDLARLISVSRLPVITGIGHEIDFTLADFAADLRAATPTAAAELATPITITDYRTMLSAIASRMGDLVERRIDTSGYDLDFLKERLDRLSPEYVITAFQEQLAYMKIMLERNFQLCVVRLDSRIKEITGIIRNVDPHSVLKRGYAYVMTPDRRLISHAAQVKTDERLKIVFAASEIDVKVEGESHDEGN